MPKDNQTDEARDGSGNISRKEFEKELSKLQVELTPAADLGQSRGATRCCGLRGPGHGRQGRRD